MVIEHTPQFLQTDALPQDRLRALCQIIQHMNSVCELPELLAYLLDRVLEDTGGRRGYLLLAREPADDDGPHLEVKAIQGDGIDAAQAEADVLRFVGRTVVRDVLRRAEPCVIEDLQQDVRYKDRTGSLSSQLKWRSILIIPLKVADRLIGLMYIEHPGRNAFPNPDLDFLSAFATSATVAIENARLFAEARQARELRALNETAAVLGSTLELGAILETGLAKALDVIRAEAGAVSLLDGESGELVVAATRGWRRDSAPVDTRIPAGEGLSGYVAAAGEVLVTGDVAHDPRVAVEAFSDEGVQAVVLVPMRAGGQVVGVLSAMNYAPRTFTTEEIDMLSAIGGMFGVAVENARLYEEVRSKLMQLAYLNEVGGALTANLDLEQVMQVIMEGVNSLIGVERVSIFLVNEATNDLVLEYSADVRETVRLSAPWPGIAGWIATHDKPAIVNDVRHDPRFLPDIDAVTQFDTRSILGVPLKLDDRLIGVVEALNKLGGPFTEKDRDRLADFSKWAAIALHNARLYRELDEAAERLASAEAIAVMGDIALNLTHELNDRISIARINANRIQTKCKDELRNPYLKKKVKEIHRVAAESLTIIRRIREPFEIADVEPLNVSDCLAEALSGFRLEPGIETIEHYQPDLPSVVATREKLIEAFCYVIGNALEAMGEKGHLWLSTRHRLDGLVEVVIADDGPGIPPEIRARLFELGFTTKPAGGGSLGLGLWWTRTYVGRLGGQVKLSSTPGRETVVSIRLPAAHEASLRSHL